MVKKAKGKKVVESRGGGAGVSSGSGSLFKKNARNFRLGGDIQPKRDLTRFVKWPRYVRIQRQKRILMQRLKVPPAINQFSQTVEKNQAAKLIKLMSKYMPETRTEKTTRMRSEAEAGKGGAFCFIRGKANLGKLVHLKTATCVAITDVRREDIVDLEQMTTMFKTQFNDNANLTRKWGGGIMGIKNQHMMAARAKLIEIEERKKALV